MNSAVSWATKPHPKGVVPALQIYLQTTGHVCGYNLMEAFHHVPFFSGGLEVSVAKKELPEVI